MREIGCHLACHHDCQHKVSKNCGVDEKGMREILSNLKPIDDVNLFLICVFCYTWSCKTFTSRKAHKKQISACKIDCLVKNTKII